MWFSNLIDNYKSNRERKRWDEISKVIPHISTPPLPSFSESSYTVRGLKYDAWREEFVNWRNQVGPDSPIELMHKRRIASFMDLLDAKKDCARWHGERSMKGKEYAAEDRLWRTYFDEWKKTCLIPAIDRINKWIKQESDNRRNLFREEYCRRFGVYPPAESVPERYFPSPLSESSWLIKGMSIPRLYERGRRNV